MSDIDRHQAFIAAYLTSGSAATAAMTAGYSPRAANRMGAKLLATPLIRSEIARRTAEYVERGEITREQLIDEAESARRKAEANDNPSAMISAVTLKAKLAGFLVHCV
jgi:phage terminase small subunit